MEDERIIELYWSRSEDAIAQTDKKYGGFCGSIAYSILADREDARECVNDTYLDAWNAMPPSRPNVLSAFLGKITRRISIDRWRSQTAQKRGGGQLPLALEELGDCVAGTQDVELQLQRQELVRSVNSFLDLLPRDQRRVFLRRYWYLDSVRDIALRYGYSESKVMSMLHRTRLKLREQLRKEGY